MSGPPQVTMLPQATRERHGWENTCPGCGFSFGYPADWAALLAAVDAHLSATQAHGTDPTLPG